MTAVHRTQATVAQERTVEATGPRQIRLSKPEQFGPAAAAQLQGRMGVATAGYSAPPSGTPYENNTARFLESFLSASRGTAGFVTSPTASAGSIDALSTVAAHKLNAPLAYVTAESYLPYVKTEEFPPGVDLEQFNKSPIHYYADAADYSRATAVGSGALLVTGGRDTTVSDFMNAIGAGNKVVIFADKDVVSRDLAGKVIEFDARGRVNNASHFLADVLRPLARGETPSFKALQSVGFDSAWVEKNRSKLLSNVMVIDASNPAAAGTKAAEFVRARSQVVGTGFDD